jgi:hypothetical protein
MFSPNARAFARPDSLFGPESGLGSQQTLTKARLRPGLLGPTRLSTSLLVQLIATGQDGQIIGHGLQSFTATIRAVRVTHLTDSKPVVLIDTPSLDDTVKSDTEILAMIAKWLLKCECIPMNGSYCN